jgi:protein-tyrosine phosphatase
MTKKTRILFVCLGNIVRSPLGENMLLHLATQRGAAAQFETDSAGTAAYHIGESPDRRMREVASQRGLVYDGRARQFSARDFSRFDLIIAMDTSNRQNILRLAKSETDRAKVHLMREYDPEGGESVPDPYYGGIEGFQNVYDIVERSCGGLLDDLLT